MQPSSSAAKHKPLNMKHKTCIKIGILHLIFSHIWTVNTNILISFNNNIYAGNHVEVMDHKEISDSSRTKEFSLHYSRQSSNQITLRMNCLLVKTGVISFIRCRVTRVVSLLSPCWLLRSPSWKSFPQTTCVQCRSRSR